MEYDKGKAKAYKSTLNACSTKIIVTIARGYAEGISYAVWKARIRGTQQVMNIEQGAPVNIPIITFSESKRRPVMAPFDYPVVIELKVASALVCIILIDTRNSADIITWECLQKLKYPGRDITPLGLDGQMVNTIRIIWPPLQFEDKVKYKSLKVNFLVVDVPTAQTLYRVKVVIAPYLLRIRYESNDGVVGKLFGDQCTTHECYLVSIKPFVGQGCSEEPAVLKKPHRPEPLSDTGAVVFEDDHPDRTVKIGLGIPGEIRWHVVVLFSRVLTLGLVNNGSSLLVPLRFGQFLIPLVLLEFLWLIIFRILIHRLFVIKDDLIRTLAGSWHSLLVLNIPHSGFKIPTPSFEV
ncbi:hypothetical protein Cgig2_003738 [Carnegiea gigantea]|uniref:Uncharacterized protein n=1 Tax=Carnegiea gigantea TaxID=171969 RepID=A0A9Q1JRX8_9CARY|nr:hypothetical protein Cgig2_003738 [Carnegiea gigantea]